MALMRMLLDMARCLEIAEQGGRVRSLLGLLIEHKIWTCSEPLIASILCELWKWTRRKDIAQLCLNAKKMKEKWGFDTRES